VLSSSLVCGNWFPCGRWQVDDFPNAPAFGRQQFTAWMHLSLLNLPTKLFLSPVTPSSTPHQPSHRRSVEFSASSRSLVSSPSSLPLSSRHRLGYPLLDLSSAPTRSFSQWKRSQRSFIRTVDQIFKKAIENRVRSKQTLRNHRKVAAAPSTDDNHRGWDNTFTASMETLGVP
jgi:hypothetical protein